MRDTRGRFGIVGSGQMGTRLARLLPDAVHIPARASDYSPIEDCTAVIECAAEDFTTKLDVLRRIEEALDYDALILTNTSSLDVMALSGILSRPERFGLLHVMNPPHLIKTCETWAEDTDTADAIDALATSLGFTPVRVPPIRCFAVNRLLAGLWRATASLTDAGMSTADVDALCVDVLGMRAGPCATASHVGEGIVRAILEGVSE